MILITTTVSVDAQKPASQTVIHLSQGDSGTRALRFIPVQGGAAIDMTDVAQAKVKASPLSGASDLLLSAAPGGYYADLVPTEALVESAEEWSCQLVLLDGEGQTLSTMPFTIIVHAGVYDGDTVEHTNTTVSEIRWDVNTMRMSIVLADGTVIMGPDMSHTHPLATEEIDGFMSKEQFTFVKKLRDGIGTDDPWMDQDVSQDATPTFAGIRIGDVTIDGDGTITGLRFT